MIEEELPGYTETAFFQEAIDCLPHGFAVLSAEFLPLHVNRIALQAFPAFYRGVELGLSYREALFEHVRTTYPATSEEECWQITDMLDAALASGKRADVQAADGRIFETVFRPMSGDRYVAISVDVTAERRLETELDAARARIETIQRANSTFVANLSHEIRTPLNGILGIAREVERGRLSDEAQREHGRVIVASVRALKTLLEDVADLSKTESGQMTLAPTDEELGTFLAQQHRQWRALGEEKMLSVSLEIAEDLPRRLRFDPLRLGQCISNIVGNAIKSTERGSVTITASRYDDPDGVGLRIAVAETGIGMSADKIEKLFVPFVHRESTFSPRFGDTGLGLVLTQKLAELMGGELTVASEPGKGSVLMLTIVAGAVPDRASHTDGAPSADAARQAPEAPTPAKGTRVLLVDDHPLNRRVGRLYLEPEGFLVSEAVNGQDALDRLAEKEFDLVLMDVHMPVMDGLEALSRIRSGHTAFRDIPVIAFTADAMSGDRERYVAKGMNGFISKPIEKRDLLAEIGRILGLPFEEQAAHRKPAPHSAPAGLQARNSMQ